MKRIFVMILIMICMMIGLVGCETPETTSTDYVSGEAASATNDEVGIDETLITEHFEFSVLSAELCKSVKNGLGIEYTASDENQYLVIVICAKNISDDVQNVMNVDFNSYIDDKKITIQGIAGEIDGYMPLIGAVSAGKTFEGYTVWEVPSAWNKLEFSYLDAATGSDSGFFIINFDDVSK